MRNLFIFLFVVACSFSGFAHVGSPGVTYEGKAGPYKVLVSIAPPDVIPGTAQVSVFLEGATKDVRITAMPVYFMSGKEGTPKSDEAKATDQPGRYDVRLWFMSAGASSVSVKVDGPAGKGEVLIPVMAVSTAVRTMPPGLGWGLLAMAVFLVILMVTIIGSSVSDGQLMPGISTDSKRATRRIIGSAGSLVVLALILWGGKTWWNGLAADYRDYLYQPFQATTIADVDNHILTLRIDSMLLHKMRTTGRFVTTRKLNYLVPDHGKLMHLFLVKAGELDAFAHLHPKRVDSVTFESALPELPAGKYWLYADITRLSVFAETIVDTVEIPGMRMRNAAYSPVSSAPDRDDTWFVTNGISAASRNLRNADVAICGSPGVSVPLADGSAATWMRKSGERLQAGKLTDLRFAFTGPEGKPALLDPYLGMMAHAVILKDDGTVYIHLHPNGNYSMGSQRAILDRIAFHKPISEYLPRPRVFADSIDHFVRKLDEMDDNTRNALLTLGMDHTASAGGHTAHEVSFPYAFPKAGKYRVWVQVKRNGKILNSAFDAEVKD
ncbi:hypothetical protein [Hufsiella ginkgonis]|uniref:Uncharacterized protein n=1 Tax=Hufsiella ginkgonis TaxID=2695274 RepID=A0A7K1XY90_9SPHI|nr:hypothetical protein [Hufsiella ginkgonis]MXV15965.1 hypothetical protein [Hufsiella ginkgonis]